MERFRIEKSDKEARQGPPPLNRPRTRFTRFEHSKVERNDWDRNYIVIHPEKSREIPAEAESPELSNYLAAEKEVVNVMRKIRAIRQSGKRPAEIDAAILRLKPELVEAERLADEAMKVWHQSLDREIENC
jgi:hypothetical protein